MKRILMLIAVIGMVSTAAVAYDGYNDYTYKMNNLGVELNEGVHCFDYDSSVAIGMKRMNSNSYSNSSYDYGSDVNTRKGVRTEHHKNRQNRIFAEVIAIVDDIRLV